MESHYQSPGELVGALQGRGDGARGHLWGLLREPVERILGALVASTPPAHPLEILTVHALHLAETWLRTRPPDFFTRMSWKAFRAGVLMQVAKFASAPFGGEAGTRDGPASLPECPAYLSRALLWPHERDGKHWSGGDWYAGLRDEAGTLWVILADITGHGYYAYLLASSLPGVWEACWKALGAHPGQPADVLGSMHELLADCMPEGVFAECTLVRLSPDGEVTVAPAGGTRLLLRRSHAVELVKMRGTWLGLSAPSPADQRTWTLEYGDELLLATDGLFDHLTDADGAMSLDWAQREARPLFDVVEHHLRRVLEDTPQKDDITVVMLSRRNGRPTARERTVRAGEGDVPV